MKTCLVCKSKLCVIYDIAVVVIIDSINYLHAAVNSPRDFSRVFYIWPTVHTDYCLKSISVLQ